MDPISHELWLSASRSYHRRRLIIVLASFGEAYLGQLAHAMRLPPWRVRALLSGKLPHYSPTLSLEALGCAEPHRDARGGLYWRATTKCIRKARSMTAGRVRRRRAKGERPPV